MPSLASPTPKAKVTFLLALVAIATGLSGCAKPIGPGGGSDADTMAPHPEANAPLADPIHNEQDVLAGAAPQDHPFSMPRRGQLQASLSWGTTGNQMVLMLLRDGEWVTSLGEATQPTRTELLMNIPIPPGEYTLRVVPDTMAADRWILDAIFAEAAPLPDAYGAIPVAGPHVVVGVPDSGLNVYHEVYRRPNFTVHPCRYVEGYPCDVPALNLTLDAASWQEAFEADRETWAAIKPGDRYWIPGTNIIGAVCQHPYTALSDGSTPPGSGVDYCIIDDTDMHGTGTTSSVLSENPDALLVVVEGGSGGANWLLDGFFPIDLISYSWGVPVPVPTSLLSWDVTQPEGTSPPVFATGKVPLFVAASGNEGAFPVVLAGDKAHTSIITVGAADAGSRTEPGSSGFKTMDYVSEFCRPTAQTRSLNDTRVQYCGTSLSAPTFAGALSRAILELRRASGYSGGLQDGFVDPVLGITKEDLRQALNHSATYAPTDAFQDGEEAAPIVAPWYQWGWGYFGRGEVPALLECLLEDHCIERPSETRTYMEALWEIRRTHSGEGPGQYSCRCTSADQRTEGAFTIPEALHG